MPQSGRLSRAVWRADLTRRSGPLRAAHADRIPHLRPGHAAGRGRSARPGAGLRRDHPRPAGARAPQRGAARLPDRGRDPGRQRAVGDWLLRTLSITLPAFRIAGGLLLFSIASEMVFGVRIVRQSQQAEEAIEEHVRNIAAFPLAIPLMAGPGAITATVLLAGRAGGDPHALGACCSP